MQLSGESFVNASVFIVWDYSNDSSGHIDAFLSLFFSYRYQQYFDLEGESGIVVRGIGTCVFLRKIYGASSPSTPTSFAASPRDDTEL